MLGSNNLISFDPRLAVAIGTNEAIVLTRVHFWLGTPNSGKVIDGVRWIYNSAEEWQKEHFPFWSLSTVKRTIANLEDAGLLLSRSDLSEGHLNRTKWYTIDYPAVDRLAQSDQSEQLKMNRTVPVNVNQTITRETRTEEPPYPPKGEDGSERVEQVSTTPPAETPKPEAVSVAAVPPPLDTPEFRLKWQEWKEYRVEKRCSLKPTTAAKQLAMLAKFPASTAIAMLEQSMLNGWQGIFELKNNQVARTSPAPPVAWTPLGYQDKEQPRANGAARHWSPLGG